jgi:hypothetical protein
MLLLNLVLLLLLPKMMLKLLLLNLLLLVWLVLLVLHCFISSAVMLFHQLLDDGVTREGSWAVSGVEQWELKGQCGHDVVTVTGPS